MKRNDLVTVNDLSIGDRFYVANDNIKIVYQYLEHVRMCCDTKYYDSRFEKMKTIQMASDTQVVFLRNVNTI